MSEILVIAAHPDDEALGCGATLARHRAEGDRVRVLFVADGESSRGSFDNLQARHQAAVNACRIMGADILGFLNLPDQRLDGMPLLEISQAIEKAVKGLSPVTLYIHHAGDLNADHRICSLAALTAFRPLPRSSVRHILAFEVASSTGWGHGALPGFLPDHFVDIAAFLPAKRAALEAYSAEMRPFPHARSLDAVTALATHRGACVGLRAAEAFQTLRHLR